MSKSRVQGADGKFVRVPQKKAKPGCQCCSGTGTMLAISFATGRMGQYPCTCLTRKGD